MTDIYLPLDEVRMLSFEILHRHGCDKANAQAVADVITQAEADGCHSHGLMRLPGYVAALDSGKVNGAAQPGLKHLTPVVVQIDADNGFAPYALQSGRPALIEAARTYGIGILALIRAHHFAALWTEVEPVCMEGLVGFACTSYKPAVIPAGGHKALYGTNPICFGWPRGTRAPVIFDQASSVMARGEVMLAAQEGYSLPSGVGVDAQGQPTTDPDAVLKGALLAFGGYKGASLAMMVELLSGPLIGESLSFEAAQRDNNDGGPPQGGEFMLAIDPNLLGHEADWQAHAEKLFTEMCDQDGVRLPGARRYGIRQESQHKGVQVGQQLITRLKSL